MFLGIGGQLLFCYLDQSVLVFDSGQSVRD
jgi:hypothetical protein